MGYEYPLPYWRGGSWHSNPSLVKSAGPERVASDQPAPDDWKPNPLLGFTHVWSSRSTGEVIAVAELGEPLVLGEHEPLLWEGDQS
jgi:hypothetical protein